VRTGKNKKAPEEAFGYLTIVGSVAIMMKKEGPYTIPGGTVCRLLLHVFLKKRGVKR
jgi:hypothetical protein